MLRAPRVVLVSVIVAAAATVLLSVGAPAGAEPGKGTQGQIAAAFRELRQLPRVSEGALYLQGYDRAMRNELAKAGSQLTSGIDTPVTVGESTGPADVVRPGEAAVPLTISVKAKDPPPAFDDSFQGVALRVKGRWKVSWTTMCLLVESSRQLCPPTPRDLMAGAIVPTAGSAAGGAALASTSQSTASTPGLVGPGALAIAPGGGVLIADADRDQILEWHDGTLSVIAGDGLSGFSGDGGPAVAADLDDPGPIAVAPNGTIYFVDRANHRVRAISPDGTITTVAGNGILGLGTASEDGQPATSVSLQPEGIAVSPAGILYVASDSDVVAVQPDGLLSTLVAGGPPAGVDLDVGGTPTAFYPTAMAFDGQGDLLVYSSSPKELFSVDATDGQVTLLAQNYANALAPAPGGSVLVAEHGGAPERVNGSTVTALKLTDPPQGPAYPLVADGIAEAPDGTVYVDTESGDGFNVQADLYAVNGNTVQPVPVTTPELASLPIPGAPGFPASIFPLSSPVRGNHPALLSCPSMAGVVPFTSSTEATARRLLGGWNTSFSYNLHASDRSGWTQLMAAPVTGRQTIGVELPAAGTLYAPAIAAACGMHLVDDSIAVSMGASEYSASSEHLYLLDRDGTPLVYFSAS